MAEKIFRNKFHKSYVGGEGEIAESPGVESRMTRSVTRSYEDVLAEYRWYVRDPQAELPQEIVEQMRIVGKI